MLKYFRLIRFQNLLIIAATQYLLRYALLIPMLENMGFEPQFSHLNFSFLVIATLLLVAGGYVINDYFDMKIDSLNRPEEVLVGKQINRRTAILIHIIVNAIAIILGLIISLEIGHWKLVNIFILVSVLLWFYSASFKHRYLIGNLIVALLTSTVTLLLPVMYELPPLYTNYSEDLMMLGMNFDILLYWSGAFALFAFLTTLAREIIKDAEDFEGDHAYGRRTIPVVSGIGAARATVIVLNLLVVALLAGGYFMFLHCTERFGEACLKYNYPSLIYIVVFLIVPHLFLSYKVLKANTKAQWHSAATISKISMLFGILYTLVVYFLISN